MTRDLPEGYALEIEADTMTLRAPNHHTVARFNPEAAGAEIWEAAWEHSVSVDEQMGRPKVTPLQPGPPPPLGRGNCDDPWCGICAERGLMPDGAA